MINTSKTKSLNGSALLNFDPQALWSKTLRSSPESSPFQLIVGQGDAIIPSRNRLLDGKAMVCSEPEEIRQCLSNLLPKQVFNLILPNKIS